MKGEDSGVTLNDQKAQFSIAYVKVVAAAAGFNINGIPQVDDDSVDLTLCASGVRGLSRRPKLDLQLKCSSSLQFVGDNLTFPLSRKNYDDMSALTICPRYLVVLGVPEEIDDWLEWSPDRLCLRTSAYWARVEARPALKADQQSVTVHLPRGQRLDCRQLTLLMQEANLR